MPRAPSTTQTLRGVYAAETMTVAAVRGEVRRDFRPEAWRRSRRYDFCNPIGFYSMLGGYTIDDERDDLESCTFKNTLTLTTF
jgi:hypothetical protein